MTPTPAPARIMYSGSRTWPEHWSFIVTASVRGWAERMAGRDLWPVFVHGGCPLGVDNFVDRIADTDGLEVERHPADWSTGRSAGIQRNAVMIKSRPLVVVVLRLDGSPGASYVIDAAVRARLHWELYDATTMASQPSHAVIMYSTSKAPTPVPLATLPFADPLSGLDRFGDRITGWQNTSPPPVVIAGPVEVSQSCVHELVRDQCAHCRPRAARTPGSGSVIPAKPVRRAGLERPSRPFGAMFDGECSACGTGIEAGEEIRMDDGAAVCADCGQQAEDAWRAAQ